MTKLAITIGQRNIDHPNALDRTAFTIDAELTAYGYDVARLEYQARGKTVANLEATKKGDAHADEIVVVGAHYDSVEGCPAADDNGSGVAALLAIARALAGDHLARTVRFVAFVNEEAPYFYHDSMGSLVYARACKSRGDDIVQMISLETMGYFSDAPNSQQYPFPLDFFYPSKGNFIAFVGNTSSRDSVRTAVGNFARCRARAFGGWRLPGIFAWDRLVRSMGVLAKRLSRNHDHRHRAVSKSELPHRKRSSSIARLRSLCKSRRRRDRGRPQIRESVIFASDLFGAATRSGKSSNSELRAARFAAPHVRLSTLLRNDPPRSLQRPLAVLSSQASSHSQTLPLMSTISGSSRLVQPGGSSTSSVRHCSRRRRCIAWATANSRTEKDLRRRSSTPKTTGSYRDFRHRARRCSRGLVRRTILFRPTRSTHTRRTN